SLKRTIEIAKTFVIPDGSPFGEPIRDPCTPVRDVFIGAVLPTPRGYVGPGSRAQRRSAGMTTDRAWIRSEPTLTGNTSARGLPLGPFGPEFRWPRGAAVVADRVSPIVAADDEHRFQHLTFDRFLQDRHVGESPIDAFRPVSGDKDEWNSPCGKQVGNRVDHLAIEIDVEDRRVNGGIAGGSLRIGRPTEGA